MQEVVSNRGGVRDMRIRDTAVKHVTGSAEHTDECFGPAGSLHPFLGPADVARMAMEAKDRSKPIREPFLLRGISAFEALPVAVASVAASREWPRLGAPAAPGRLLAAERLRRKP